MALSSIVRVRVLLLVGAEDASEPLLEFLEDARHFCCHELSKEFTGRAGADRIRRNEMHDVFINTSVDKTMWGQPSLFCEVRVRGSSTQSHDAVSTMLDGLRTLKTFDRCVPVGRETKQWVPDECYKCGTALCRRK